MDEQLNENPRPQNPRRRRRTQEEIIKENYLPVIIAGVSLLLIIIFVIGAIVRGISYSNAEKESAEAAYQSSVAESQAHAAEAEALIAQVSTMMANYDYDGALEAMNGFSGEKNMILRECDFFSIGKIKEIGGAFKLRHKN